MQEPWFHQVEAWRDFYVFAGTAAATLMGLMFVVVSLASATLAGEEGSRATRGFFTPIVAFFATAIIIAMLVLIPHATPRALGASLAAVAIAGLVYMIASGAQTMWRIGELGFDDWLCYVALPFLAYIVIAASGFIVWNRSDAGLYGTAAAVFVLLMVGIRNAWDLIVYSVLRQGQDRAP